MIKQIGVVLIAILYILSINFVSSIDLGINGLGNTEHYESSGGESVKVGVSDSVSVSVIKKRIYGQIFEDNGDSRVKLFYFLPLPLKIKGFNYVFVHAIALLTTLTLLYWSFEGKDE